MDALRDKRPLPSMAADETAIVNYGTEFFKTHQVSPETFKAALDQFGAQHLVELTALMGNYAPDRLLPQRLRGGAAAGAHRDGVAGVEGAACRLPEPAILARELYTHTPKLDFVHSSCVG